MTDHATDPIHCPTCNTQLGPDANFCGVCGTELSVFKETGEDPYIGRVIGGRYVVREKIGSGGMGEVYLAEHEKLGQKVAIKFLSRHLTGTPEFTRRFFNEARSTCRVGHPNAVSLNDFGQTTDGGLYIIMEYIEGEPLSHLVERDSGGSGLPLNTSFHIILQLCDVLHAAHQQGVIHRDLKPDNIMLTRVRGGRYAVKVLDFGISKLINEGDNHLTQTGTVFGTPEFMSPEQAQGLEVDGRADQYALALVFYYLVCGGRIPFSGEERLSILNMQVNDAPTTPSEMCPGADIPPPLEGVIMKALNKKPEERYASVAEFGETIEQVAARLRDDGHFDLSNSGPLAALPDLGGSTPAEGVTEKQFAARTIPVISEDADSSDDFSLGELPATSAEADWFASSGDDGIERGAEPEPGSGGGEESDELSIDPSADAPIEEEVPDATFRRGHPAAVALVVLLTLGLLTGGIIWIASENTSSSAATTDASRSVASAIDAGKVDAASAAAADIDHQPDASEPSPKPSPEERAGQPAGEDKKTDSAKERLNAKAPPEGKTSEKARADEKQNRSPQKKARPKKKKPTGEKPQNKPDPDKKPAERAGDKNKKKEDKKKFEPPKKL